MLRDSTFGVYATFRPPASTTHRLYRSCLPANFVRSTETTRRYVLLPRHRRGRRASNRCTFTALPARSGSIVARRTDAERAFDCWFRRGIFRVDRRNDGQSAMKSHAVREGIIRADRIRNGHCAPCYSPYARRNADEDWFALLLLAAAPRSSGLTSARRDLDLHFKSGEPPRPAR